MTASPSGLPFPGAGEQFATPDTLLQENIALHLPARNKPEGLTQNFSFVFHLPQLQFFSFSHYFSVL